MKTLPIRLNPGQDLRAAIEAAVRSQNCRAAFVLSGIGSLSTAALRFAGAEQPRRVEGDTEILTLSGTIAFMASAAARTFTCRCLLPRVRSWVGMWRRVAQHDVGDFRNRD